uniref:Protein farnesyltransferase subunit beta n=1 Tax=Cuerna arida TaxID=1464854 RepID=A0A1B6EPX8_9HEMI
MAQSLGTFGKSDKTHSWLNDLFKLENVPDKFDDEGVDTVTSEEQIKVEKSVESLFSLFYKKAEIDPEEPLLRKETHVSYLRKNLTHLPSFYQCLDASRPWLCYWIVHALVLLKSSLSKDESVHVAQFLGRCQNEDGGFGGGPGQLSHLAPTYAAINTLCSLALPESYSIINREKLKRFLWSVRQDDGSFCMHVGGEVDIRGLYCALSVARLTNVYTEDLFSGSAEWIVTCQTYEGGFSGTPGMEAHGGYAFCAIAALSLLCKEHLCDIKSLLRWTVNRQMQFEGGFQGRTNKLVDGCYSFWQGGAFPIIQRIICMQGDERIQTERWLFHSTALQQYILVCCQDNNGGLIDKPTKPRDIYHSCYTLSGLSVAQHQPVGKPNVLGSVDNLLEPVHPLYNIGLSKVKPTTDFFMQLSIPP